MLEIDGVMRKGLPREGEPFLARFVSCLKAFCSSSTLCFARVIYIYICIYKNKYMAWPSIVYAALWE